MNIGIITIALGSHNKYLKDMKESIVSHFLPGENITIYDFDKEIPILPWPLITLLRYHFICENKSKFSKEDILYWMDADMKVIEVDKEILPDNTGLVGVSHSAFHNAVGKPWLPFESKNTSMAYIDVKNIIKPYVQGCLQGGEASKFLSMCETLKSNIEKDLSNNYIAVWHDESHLNRYYTEHAYKLLDPGYAYPAFPENLSLPFKKRIMHNNHYFHEVLKKC